MMGIVHSALRRDLERARIVLGGDVDDARRGELAGHLVWLMAFLHDHHEGEDEGLYPMVRARAPQLAAILDEMHAEHAAIVAAMTGLSDVAQRWQHDASAQTAVIDGLAALCAVLHPHLEHEEREMMPLVSQAITQREWHDWDQERNVKSRGPKELAFTGHWLIDGASPEERHRVITLVPAAPRFVLLHLMGGPYKRKAASLWVGTRAADVPLIAIGA